MSSNGPQDQLNLGSLTDEELQKLLGMHGINFAMPSIQSYMQQSSSKGGGKPPSGGGGHPMSPIGGGATPQSIGQYSNALGSASPMKNNYGQSQGGPQGVMFDPRPPGTQGSLSPTSTPQGAQVYNNFLDHGGQLPDLVQRPGGQVALQGDGKGGLTLGGQPIGYSGPAAASNIPGTNQAQDPAALPNINGQTNHLQGLGVDWAQGLNPTPVPKNMQPSQWAAYNNADKQKQQDFWSKMFGVPGYDAMYTAGSAPVGDGSASSGGNAGT